MKILTHCHHLNIDGPVILSQKNFNAPNPVLLKMIKALHPDFESYVTVNHFEENNLFMQKNINIETIRHFKEAEGFIIDQVFTDNFHSLDQFFLHELSQVIGDRHFIIGPSFNKVPSFLQSRLLDEAVEFDVSAVMFDMRETDMSDFKSLQPLAKLKTHAKKRIEIIPVVKSPEQKDELLRNIPFDMIYIHPEQ